MGGGIESMAITEAFGGKTDGFVLSFFFFFFFVSPLSACLSVCSWLRVVWPGVSGGVV